MTWAERLDREVFEKFWREGDFRVRAFLKNLYEPCYPDWPEFGAIPAQSADMCQG